MLSFMRRYQRFFFVIITAVIVVSFSFFGSYGSITDSLQNDRPAFTRVDGKVINFSQLQEMQRFLASDGVDKLLHGGVRGPNGLNDGMVRYDILATGIGRLLAVEYLDLLASDLKMRSQRERRYKAYVHPGAPFLTAETIWEHYAPELKETFEGLRDVSEPVSADAFARRTALYLAENNFPQPVLKQVVRMHEGQYDWIEPDQMLERRDLSLFGYHSLEDWFGPRFLTLVSQFVINAAAEAESRGYQVSRQEAWSALAANAQLSFERLTGSPHVNARSAEQFLQDELHDLGLTRESATDVWRQALLFRRYFDDMGSSVLLDRFAFDEVHAYGAEELEVERFRLAPELHLHNGEALQAFEIYREAVAADERDLPLKFKAAEEVPPELAQRRFLLRIAQASKADLRRKVPVRGLLNWQLDEKNWPALVAEVPELSGKAHDRAARFALLEGLKPNRRAQANRQAQDAIIAAQPDWLTNALDGAQVEEQEIAVVLAGGRNPLPDLTERDELIDFLDALVDGQSADYTESDDALFRLEVLETHPVEVLTFAQARASGSLTDLVRRKLLAHYQKVRQKDPAPFRDDEGHFKRLAEVRDLVAADYFGPMEMTDAAAAHRFDLYMRQVREVGEPIQLEGLAAQWQVSSASEHVARGAGDDELFELEEGALSEVLAREGQLPSFVRVGERTASDTTHRALEQAQVALSAEAKRQLMQQLLQTLREKDAIKLEVNA